MPVVSFLYFAGMDLFLIITIVISLSAVFGYINTRFVKLPQTIGLMVIAVFFSLAMLIVNAFSPTVFSYAKEIIESIDFSKVLLDVMLCFLLFAGALHTDGRQILAEKKSIILLSLVGIIISTFVIAGLLYLLTAVLNYPLSFIYCLLFGALISPTDPIAVLGILTKSNVPKRIETNIVGESLFNDGVGVVIFATILQVIRSSSTEISVGSVAIFFIQEAAGGVLFGFLLGYIILLLLKSIDHYETEVMITIAIVMSGYYIASLLHISGPLAMVVAGLFTGSKTSRQVVSETTHIYLDKFWELVDVLMNAILFVLIGLRLMLLDFTISYLIIGLLTIPVVLIGRWVSVSLPLLFAKRWITFDKKAQFLMIWGGLRGGLSFAMALSLSGDHNKDLLVFTTYIIVLFSIIVQGLTVGKLAKKLYKD
ncbi:MAG: sodium:proton antiporter [Panacibacter sp.]